MCTTDIVLSNNVTRTSHTIVSIKRVIIALTGASICHQLAWYPVSSFSFNYWSIKWFHIIFVFLGTLIRRVTGWPCPNFSTQYRRAKGLGPFVSVHEMTSIVAVRAARGLLITADIITIWGRQRRQLPMAIGNASMRHKHIAPFIRWTTSSLTQ